MNIILASREKLHITMTSRIDDLQKRSKLCSKSRFFRYFISLTFTKKKE